MRIERLKARVRRKPFRPVRITLHAGDPVTARHPENTMFMREGMVGATEPAPTIFEPEAVVSVLHV